MKYLVILITLITCLNCSTKEDCDREAFNLLGQLNQTEYEYYEDYNNMYYRIDGLTYRCLTESVEARLKVIPFTKTTMKVEK